MVRIIDTSLAIKWFAEEEGREEALEILAELLEAPQLFAVPELFYFELLHVFYRLFSDASLEQKELLDAVLGFGMTRFSITTDLANEVKKFISMGLSGYDAAYVALARVTRGVWLTCDKKAHQKVAHLGLSQLV